MNKNGKSGEQQKPDWKKDAVELHRAKYTHRARRQNGNGFHSHIKFADHINEDLFAFVCLENWNE